MSKKVMEEFEITGDNIHLNQLLKLLHWCESGADANAAIENGEVKVNGEVELRKRNKIRKGMKVEFDGQIVVVN
ncbi:MAG: RNA-binding S4 domain-containing protein [Bacteroidota bacterium]